MGKWKILINPIILRWIHFIPKSVQKALTLEYNFEIFHFCKATQDSRDK